MLHRLFLRDGSRKSDKTPIGDGVCCLQQTRRLIKQIVLFRTLRLLLLEEGLGNAVSPVEIAQKFGADALRAGLLSSFEFGNDGDFSMSQLEDFYSTKLASGVGNLFNRVIVLLHKFTEGNIPETQGCADSEELLKSFNNLLEQKKLKGAYDFFFKTVDQANQLLNETEVWKLAKTDPAAAHKIFVELYEYLKFLTHMSAVLLPESAPKMQAMLGQNGQIGEAVILFERV